MKPGAGENRTYSARSYEEAQAIERSREETNLKSIVMRTYIAVWIFFANALLWVIKKIYFKGLASSDGEPTEIVVYTVGTLGDNVLMLPAVAAVKRWYPVANVTVITNCDGFSEHPAREIFSSSPYVDRFIALPEHPVKREGFRMRVHLPGGHERMCDLFINLSPFGNRGLIGGVIREMVLARHLGAKQAIGFRMATYNRRDAFNRVQHRFMKNEARRTRGVLSEIGLLPVENEDLLGRDEAAKRKVSEMLSSYWDASRPLVVLNPGAKLRVSQWPAERFGLVAAWLIKAYNACVVLNGTLSERGICDEVVNASGGLVLNLAGELSIQELIELLRMSSACISNNTGPMTLTAMLGVPTVVLSSTRFSPTFYIPVSEKMVWLFSFNSFSYSYNDAGGPGSDLLQIEVSDVRNAFEGVYQAGSIVT